MKSFAFLAATAAAILAPLAPAQALKINLIDNGTVAGTPASQGFKIAAKYWESVITNDANVNFEVGFSDLGPNVLGSTGSNLVTYVPIDAYQYLLGATGTSTLDAQAFSHLQPTSVNGSVTVKVPDYFNTGTMTGVAASGSRLAPDNSAISNTIALSTANLKALIGGLDNVIDAQIQFSSTFAFDFNPTNGIAHGKYDFIGVAIHEMGHALGFLSGADDFDYSVGDGFPTDEFWWGYGLDMFRYSAPGVLDWTFNTDSYFSLDGGVTPYLDGYFSTGSVHGDGWQASHWKEPATPCQDFRGIMNPYICNGLTDSVTGLDLALFDAIGWNVNVDVAANPGYAFSTKQSYAAFAASVPEPTSWAMLIAGFGLTGAVMRRQRRTLSKTVAD
jgi:hypothetical protein